MPAREHNQSIPHATSRRPRARLLPKLLGGALAGTLSLPSIVGLATTGLIASFGLITTGCGTGPVIPGTEIPDTRDNRQIIATLERYRTSFISRDAAAVLSTAHPTYYDTAGTDDPSDDVTYAELGPQLRRRLSQLDSIRFTIDYLEILGEGDRAVVRVWLDSSFRFKPLLDSYGEPRVAPPFSRVMDHSEFELVREGENWLIVKGM